MTTDQHHSDSHDPTRHARCICGAHLSAPTRAAHEAHVAEATRATTQQRRLTTPCQTQVSRHRQREG